MSEYKSYEVWLEGYAATGQFGTAQYLGAFTATSFVEACTKAMDHNHMDTRYFQLGTHPSYWGCRFYDNESDARRSFG